MKAAAAQNLCFSVKVLQAGEVVAEAEKPLQGRWRLALTNSPRRPFSIPFYSMPKDTFSLRYRRRQVEMHIGVPWEGMVKRNGRVLAGSHPALPGTTLELKSGDYGSIDLLGLTLVFKVAHAKQKLVSSRSSTFSGNPFALLNLDRAVAVPLVCSIVLAALFLAGAIAGFLSRRDFKPQTLSELGEHYSLRFIDPDHLRTLPEAMNEKLKDGQSINQALQYYSSVAALMTDSEIPHPRLLLASSIENRRIEAERASERLREWDSAQEAKDEAMSRNPYQAAIILPSAISRPTEEMVQEEMERIHFYHEGLDQQLEMRRKTTGEMAYDTTYDYVKYSTKKDAAPAAPAKQAHDPKLEKIKMTTDVSDEDRVYLSAQALAARAQTLQQQTLSPIKPRPARPLLWIDAKLAGLSFSSGSLGMASASKLAAIDGVRFGETPKREIRQEPALGEADPEDIERVILENQFQLRLCFESALRRNHALKGMMRWRWRIDQKGQPSNMQLISSSIQDEKMISCVRDTMHTWVFPKPRKGSVLVNRAFEFQPETG